MIAVLLTELGDNRKEAVQFGTLELECHWMYKSGTQEQLVGNTLYALMHPKYVVELMEVDR